MEPPAPRAKRRWDLPVAGLLVFCVVMLVVWAGRGDKLVHISGPAQGTTYNVKLKVDRSRLDYEDERLLREQIADVLTLVDVQMSTYREDSEISRLNRLPAGEPQVLSNGLAHIMERSLELSRLTDGAFDITVGPVVNAYGFGPATQPATLPGDDLIDEIRQRIGYRKLQFEPATRTIRKVRSDVFCDLNAIAPGYAVDRLCGLLDDLGYQDYMVELGGEVRVKGVNLEGEPWRIGVEKPVVDGSGIQLVLPIRDKAVSTSGDYRQYVMADGRRLSHTIDPRTGRPVLNGPASVSVIHDECEWADGWATALMVLSPDEGYNLAERQGLAVLFMMRGADDTITSRATSAFAAMFPNNSEGQP